MLVAQKGSCSGGNGGRAGCDGKKLQCRDSNGTYTHPECAKCGCHHQGGAAACIEGRNLQKEKAYLEHLLKIQERTLDNKENGGPNAADQRQANAAAAAAKVVDDNKSPD
eukprot:1372336-Rhodomonas_salina.1